MSGETEDRPSGWTTDTLYLHLSKLMYEKDLRDNQRFEAQQLALRDALTAQEKAVNAALTAAQTAVQKAEVAAEKRFDAVNEFRAQLADQAGTFMPRNEAQVLISGLKEQIDRLAAHDQVNIGRTAGADNLMKVAFAVLGAAGVIFGIVQSINH